MGTVSAGGNASAAGAGGVRLSADEGGLRRCNGCRGNKKVESQESEV